MDGISQSSSDGIEYLLKELSSNFAAVLNDPKEYRKKLVNANQAANAAYIKGQEDLTTAQLGAQEIAQQMQLIRAWHARAKRSQRKIMILDGHLDNQLTKLKDYANALKTGLSKYQLVLRTIMLHASTHSHSCDSMQQVTP